VLRKLAAAGGAHVAVANLVSLQWLPTGNFGAKSDWKRKWEKKGDKLLMGFPVTAARHSSGGLVRSRKTVLKIEKKLTQAKSASMRQRKTGKMGGKRGNVTVEDRYKCARVGEELSGRKVKQKGIRNSKKVTKNWVSKSKERLVRGKISAGRQIHGHEAKPWR